MSLLEGSYPGEFDSAKHRSVGNIIVKLGDGKMPLGFNGGKESLKWTLHCTVNSVACAHQTELDSFWALRVNLPALLISGGSAARPTGRIAQQGVNRFVFSDLHNLECA
jgi:hypothetical protein